MTPRNAGTKGTTVLVIDDEERDRRLCADALVHAGFDVIEAPDGPAGLRMLHERRPDVVLLDVIMPSMDGWVVCQRIRELSDVAVIMLTSLNREAEIVRGLELGADDFLSKPVSPRHLAARVRAVLRRRSAAVPPAPEVLYDDGLLAIDAAGHEVTLAGEPVALTPTEFRLLVALAETPGRVRTYAELLGAVWGPEYIDDVDFLRVYVWRLRKKLEPGDVTGWIRTERGFGYRFVPAERRPTPAPAARSDTDPRAVDRPLVLLVEDDAVSVKLMRDALQASGFATEETGNGADALRLAAELRPDLIVMDIGLPGLDGVEATRRLKAEPATSATPVVAVTAYAMQTDEDRMREAGCEAFLTKPLRFAQFVTVVRETVEAARTSPARD